MQIVVTAYATIHSKTYRFSLTPGHLKSLKHHCPFRRTNCLFSHPIRRKERELFVEHVRAMQKCRPEVADGCQCYSTMTSTNCLHSGARVIQVRSLHTEIGRAASAGAA